MYLLHLPKYFSQVLFFFILNQHLTSLSGRSQHAILYSRLIPCHIKRVTKFVSLRLMSCWLTLLRQLTSRITSYQLTETSLHSNFSMGQLIHPEFSPLSFVLTDKAAGDDRRKAINDLSTGGPIWWFMWSLTSVDDGSDRLVARSRSVRICYSIRASPLRPVIRARQLFTPPHTTPACIGTPARTPQHPDSAWKMQQSLRAGGIWLRLKLPFRLL